MPVQSEIVRNVQPAMSIVYNNIVYELKRAGKDVIVLSLGEPFFDIPLLPFDDLPFPALYHYSHSRGIPELRAPLAEYFAQQYAFRFDPESEIVVTAGSKAAIHMALMTMLDPGDEVLIPEPAWVSYTEQVKLCGGVPVCIPYDVCIERCGDYVTPKSKCIIVNNPHNPTGRVLSEAQVKCLLALADAKDLFLLADEAYSDFLLHDDRFVSFGAMAPGLERVVICNSISKNYGISGWRLGYAISNSGFINQLLKVQQHVITCPATVLQQYIAKHFHEIITITKPQIRALIEMRRRVQQHLDEIGLASLPGTATFYLFVSIEPSKLGSEAFCTRLLKEDHVSTVPGVGYGKSCDRFIRISVGTEPWDRILKGLAAVKSLVDRTA
jgi:aspartate aminotransferase/aminotransferase